MEKGKTIRLVACDLDGTLLDEKGRPSASALSAVEQLLERDIFAALVSGRSIRRSIQALDGHSRLIDRMHVCGYNGAGGVGPAEEGRRPTLYERRLPEKTFLALVDHIHRQDLNLVYCRCEEGPDGLVEEYRYLRETEETQGASDWIGPGYVCDPFLIERIRSGELGPPPKIMLAVEKERQDRAIADLRERFGKRIYLTWAVKDFLEIMPPGTDKGVALQDLSLATGVPLEQILAIGDGNNDLPMLRRAGLGVLMGNAETEVRKEVEGTDILLAPSFEEDGFARSIREWVLAGRSP